MPTIYSRLAIFEKANKKRPLTQQQRRDLGQIVIKEYLSFDIQAALHRVHSKEPGWEGTVLSYPKFYVHEIDRLIKEFHLTKVTKIIPKRKRIYTQSETNQKVGSAKPSNRT